MREYLSEKEYDVLVVGGGVAGVAAAVAAARRGVRVLLLEKCINLGGLATTGLISWYEPLCDGDGTQMMASLPEELLRLSIRYGFDTLPEKWGGEGRLSTKRERYATHFSPTVLMLVLDRWLRENGVELLFDALATYPVMQGERCVGVEVETVGGRMLCRAEMVIDATGTAVIMKRAGVPTEDGLNWASFVAHAYNAERAAQFTQTQNPMKIRTWVWAGSDLNGNGQPEGLPRVSGVTAEQVTDFVLAGKERFFEKFIRGDRFSYDVLALPGMPQFRTVCRIVGEYVFDGSEDGVKFEDAIGSCGDFRKKGKHFQIPYRCLYNKKFGNLLAAGRVISATGEGWEITRVIPVAVLTGEAAGVAAALCVQKKTTADALPIEELQNALRENGVLFL